MHGLPRLENLPEHSNDRNNRLQMMGRACRPLVDDHAVCLMLCHTPRKEFLKKFLYDPIPVESALDQYLAVCLCFLSFFFLPRIRIVMHASLIVMTSRAPMGVCRPRSFSSMHLFSIAPRARHHALGACLTYSCQPSHGVLRTPENFRIIWWLKSSRHASPMCKRPWIT